MKTEPTLSQALNLLNGDTVQEKIRALCREPSPAELESLAKLWDPGGNPLRSFEPFADLALKVAVTHDGGRVVAGDWSGEIRLFSAADGKRIALLPSNPPPPPPPASAK